tara:strand:- start:313 stop:2907 length:2595 start_codon:yes stop_codon:yes gene_type:complete
MFNNQIIAGSSGQGGGSFYPYSIDQSLRFEESGTANLSFTPSNNGTDNKKFTYSVWVKRGQESADDQHLIQSNNTGSGTGQGHVGLLFSTSNKILVYSQNGAGIATGTRSLRDHSGWYHFCFVYDTTQATAADRLKVYVNGVEDVNSGYFPPLNSVVSSMNYNGQQQYIGKYVAGFSRYFNGYMAELHMVDGQALTPSEFGETQEGVWVPKKYADNGATSHGVNGYHLTFQGTGTATTSQGTTAQTNIGDDQSGNGNNWTANNLAATDVLPDTPTNNFCTMNSIAKKSTVTLSEGNLKSFSNDGSIIANVEATFGISSGKWYFEASGRSGSNVGYPVIYLADATTRSFNNTNYAGNGCSAYGAPLVNGSLLTRVASLSLNSTSEVRQFAFDFDDGKMWIGKNGTWYDNSGTSFTNSTGPESGNNFNSNSGFTYDVGKLFSGHNDGNCAITFNFGQDSTFVGGTTAGGNTDGNGIGDFKHPVPSGFLALCSANLPDSTIGPGQTALAEDYFVPYIYTADGTSPKSRTGLGFSPDFLWFKDRTVSLSHALYDTIRGPNKGLQTNSTSAENSYNALNSFDADGFTTITDGVVGNLLNNSTDSYVAWSWKAGGTPTATNSAGAGAVPTSGSVLIDGVASTSALAGTIAANKISANTEAGFSLINYTGNGLSSQTVGHGLSSTPEFLIHKDRGTNSNNGQWNAWHKYAGDGDDYGYLSATNAFTGSAQIIPNGTDTIELKANLTTTNQSGHSFIMYAFHSVEGYSRVGSFEGNSNVDGAFVYTGFRPSFVLFRSAAISANWYIIDNKRNPSNVVNKYLRPIISNTEGSLDFVDFLSNGFKLRSSSTEINGTNVIYLAFAETPFKYANAR